MHKTKKQISYNMQQVKSKDTKIEVMLRKELWSRGLRYQKNSKKVFGKPDIVFIGKKVAVFCDSEFWHGYDWDNKKKDIVCASLPIHRYSFLFLLPVTKD